MKYSLKFFLTLLLFTFIASGTQAQIFKKLKKKAQDALENKAEQKIDAEIEKAADRMVDNSWDTVFGGMAKNGEPSSSSPFALNNNVTTEEVYSFDIITTMKVSSTDDKGKTEAPLYMDMHFNEGAQYTGTKLRGGEMDKQKGNLFIIYDVKNSAMVMLMEDKDQKFSFAYDWQQAMAHAKSGAEKLQDETGQHGAGADTEGEQLNDYKKIGTKTIAGLECQGYRTQNEQQVTDMWVSRENTYGMEKLFSAHTNSKQLKGKIPEDYPQGMLMAMNSENTETGEKIEMRVIDIRKNIDVTYTMADYPTMSAGKK